MKLEVGTEVVINDKAPINRYATVVFVPPMMNQLGKRGTIIQSDEKHNSTHVYQIRTEDGEIWWYMTEWFQEAPIYTGF